MELIFPVSWPGEGEIILGNPAGPNATTGGRGGRPRERLQPLLALKMEEGPRVQTCQRPLEAGKGEEVGSPLEHPEKEEVLPTP